MLLSPGSICCWEAGDKVPVPVFLLQASLLGLGLGWACIILPVSSRLVSQPCGGPGPAPEGGRGRTVANFRLGCGALAIFSKLKINMGSFTA